MCLHQLLCETVLSRWLIALRHKHCILFLFLSQLMSNCIERGERKMQCKGDLLTSQWQAPALSNPKEKAILCEGSYLYLPVLSFLSQFGEFCLHQLDFCRPVPLHKGARLSASPVIHKLDPKFKCEPHTSCHRSFLCGSSRCAEHAEQIRWSVNCLIGGKFCYFLIGFSCLLFLVIRHPNSFALWFWWWWIWCTSSDSGCESAC